ncbi:MAG: hypothetical protein KY442_01565 [Proteobacteria bacterium]|nr:hypothetical protein [Pseudomonadota bacterium]
MNTSRIAPRLACAALALILGACVSTAPVAPVVSPDFDAAAAIGAIRAAGAADADELQVQPLRDPQVEDLREQAAALEAQGAHRAAADRLDQALAINPDDPALLQERAEAALLLREIDDAERLALQAFELGSQVGPLCRRHWETVAQVRAARPPAVADASTPQAAPASPAEARARRDACTVAPPARF